MRNPHRTSLVMALLMAASGSAAASGQDAGTPAQGTTHVGAILEITEDISGHILPELSDTFTMYTRADIGRANVVTKAHVGGWLGHLANRAFDGPPPLTADIFRLDRNTAYKVMFPRRQYWQCTMDGCPTLYKIIESLADLSTDSPHDDDSSWSPTGTDSCPLTPVSHDYTVQDTGRSATINGFSAHLYTATFKTVYRDPQGRRNQNTLQWKFWTTPPTDTTRRIWAIHQQIADRFMQESHADASPWSRFVSRKIWRPLDVFLGDTSSHNSTNWTSSVNRKLAEVKGFPVRVTAAWYVDAQACPPPPPRQESDADTLAQNAAGGIGGMLSGLIRKHVEKAVETRIEKHFQPDPNQPVFEYDRNILSATIAPIPDSVFEVPAGFTRTQPPKLPSHAADRR